MIHKGWPKGKPRGPQTPEHIAKTHTLAIAAKTSATHIKNHQEHPEARLKSLNTPEEFALIQQYGSPLINTLRGKYRDITYRCNCKSGNPNYKWYAGRGIQNLFTSRLHFLNYVINELHITTFKQIKGLQIDRIDNNSHYTPGNIRFVTPKVNINNRRSTQLRRK